MLLAFLLCLTHIIDEPPRTILAIGAHAGDVELTSGAVLAHHAKLGDRVVILHLTLGEGGNPKMAPSAYGEQKRREASAAARALGAEVLFAPYNDGELPDSDDVRRYIAGVIREVKPTHLITHWKNSIHRDHATTHRATVDAVLLAVLPGVIIDDLPAHRGLRAVYYAENWEDADNFDPYVYVDVSDSEETWRKAIREYEFIRGGLSDFAYSQYYESLHGVRGAQAGKAHAIAFDIDPLGKKRILERLP